jgi:hypothetical protein
MGFWALRYFQLPAYAASPPDKFLHVPWYLQQTPWSRSRQLNLIKLNESWVNQEQLHLISWRYTTSSQPNTTLHNRDEVEQGAHSHRLHSYHNLPRNVYLMNSLRSTQQPHIYSSGPIRCEDINTNSCSLLPLFRVTFCFVYPASEKFRSGQCSFGVWRL